MRQQVAQVVKAAPVFVAALAVKGEADHKPKTCQKYNAVRAYQDSGSKTVSLVPARVVCFTRHGDRTPAYWCENPIGGQIITAEELAFWKDNERIRPPESQRSEWQRFCPYDQSVAKPVAGSLTSLGAATQFANGVWLRRRYVHELLLLPPTLEGSKDEDTCSNIIRTFSTPYPRTCESAQNMLLGLYPPETRGSGEGRVLTPVEARAKALEPMYGAWFADSHNCPRLLQHLHEEYTEMERNKSAEDRAFEDSLRQELGGMNINGNLALADAIRCQQQYGLPRFKGWSDEKAARVRDYCWRTFMARYRRAEFLDLLLYRLAPPLLDALEPAPGAPALTIFSGHDACPVLPVLVGLGLWDEQWPDYSSLLTLEVLRPVVTATQAPAPGTGPLLVRAMYNGEQRDFQCGRADGLCPLDVVKAMVKARIISPRDACMKRVSSSPVVDCMVEAPLEVLLDGVTEGFGAGNHGGGGTGGVGAGWNDPAIA